ncbi:MAG: polyphenol oxidase family protein [Candidatus Krumholzibacteria bacterium]|nr:polyphenol oxidase family protein [Candidatus Krumholzibacteria bacterium]
MITRSGLTLGTFPALKAIAPGLDVFVTTRGGGTSLSPFDSLNLGGTSGDRPANIDRNRRLLLEALGIAPRALARAGQIHGTEIAVVTKGGRYPGIDGFATEKRGLALAISTADCHSVVIYSPPERALAAMHVGRRGAEGGIIGRAVGVLRERFRIDPRYAIAIVGPGICGRCYSVSREDALRFPKEVRRYDRGRWRLDLSAFIIRDLAAHGIRRRNVFSSRLCTACTPSLFFSHRRDGGVTGRNWTLAVIRPDSRAAERCV